MTAKGFAMSKPSVSGEDFNLFKGTLIQIWKSAPMSSSSRENNMAKISP